MTTRNGTDVVEHAIGRLGELVLRVQTGDVTVEATDGETVVVRDLDGRSLEDGFQIERGEGRLAIGSRDRVVFDLGFVRRGRGSARLAVGIPRHAAISIETASADVRAAGLLGEQRYRTASGDLVLSGVAGALAVDAVSGTVAIDAAGDVDLSGRLVSGDLRLEGGALRSIAIGTTSGDVDLAAPLDGPGPYSVQSVSGDVSVLAGAGGLRVEARTLTGDITTDAVHRSESGRGRRSLVVGEGAIELTFKSISGDLRIASPPAGSGGVASHASPESPAPPVAPAPPAPPDAPADPAAAADSSDGDPRLDVLRAVEAGTIDIETASRRLAEIEEGTEA